MRILFVSTLILFCISGYLTASIDTSMQLTTPVNIGEPERDFSLPKLDGSIVKLSDFKGKKAVLLSVGNPYT
jgi:hypothetical protein